MVWSFWPCGGPHWSRWLPVCLGVVTPIHNKICICNMYYVCAHIVLVSYFTVWFAWSSDCRTACSSDCGTGFECATALLFYTSVAGKVCILYYVVMLWKLSQDLAQIEMWEEIDIMRRLRPWGPCWLLFQAFVVQSAFLASHLCLPPWSLQNFRTIETSH